MKGFLFCLAMAPTQLKTYAAFTHAGLTTRFRTKSVYKSIFLLSRSRDI